MASRWRKARDALLGNLNLNLCVGGYAPLDGGGGSSSQASAVPPPPVTLKDPASGSFERMCAICLDPMEPGNGGRRALFAAECGHTFHFRCIAAGAGHGGRACPVCRAIWKEVPVLARPLPPDPHVRRRPSRRNPAIPAREPRNVDANIGRTASRYDDDEPLAVRAPPQQEEARGTARSRTMECAAWPEFPEVPRSAAEENFTVLIKLKAPATTSAAAGDVEEAIRAPIDLVTVLDVSGSMAGSKLALLKRAMEFLVSSLGPSDRLSVVSFSSTAKRLFPLRGMSEPGREHAIRAVNSLVAGGGTNIAEGLRKGAKVVGDRRAKNPVCGIMLLSDGQDTCRNARGRLARPQRSVPVHTFGFGADHDPDRMHSISERSGGTFSFVESAAAIRDAFAQCIGGLLSVELQEVRVDFECVDPKVDVQSLKTGSYPNCISNQKRAGTIDVGDLYAGEERNFLVSINVPPAASGAAATDLLKIRCRYKDPISGADGSLDDVVARIRRPEVVASRVASAEVERQRIRVMAADGMAEARNAAERGSLEEAVSVLERCRKALGEAASGAEEGDGLLVALDVELKEMQARMESKRRYEASGRAYVLSGLSSHSWQRATTRGDSSADSESILLAYRTPAMADMIQFSQTFDRPDRPPAR